MRKQYVLATNNFDKYHKFIFVLLFVAGAWFNENPLAYKQDKGWYLNYGSVNGIGSVMTLT